MSARRGSGAGDRIYNGALDNAAGIAALLEAARAAAAAPDKPRRSIMFLATTAEEKGLLGADYYARHPTVPLAQIVGNVDLDMPHAALSVHGPHRIRRESFDDRPPGGGLPWHR